MNPNPSAHYHLTSRETDKLLTALSDGRIVQRSAGRPGNQLWQFLPADNHRHAYFIVDASTGECLTINIDPAGPAAPTPSGEHSLALQPVSGQPGQKWTLRKTHLEGEPHCIISEVKGPKGELCVDIRGHKQGEDTPIIGFRLKDLTKCKHFNQVWSLAEIPAGPQQTKVPDTAPPA